jgi:hypothetical protein
MVNISLPVEHCRNTTKKAELPVDRISEFVKMLRPFLKGGLAVPFPMTALPTIGQFVEKAVEQGCRLATARVPIIGPRGKVTPRYLESADRKRFVILPNEHDSERLAPSQVANFVRVLGVSGFEHCYPADHEDYEYVAAYEGPSEDEET